MTRAALPFEYSVRRSPRAKRMLVTVKPGRGVEVVVPERARVAPDRIEELVRDHADAIVTALRQIEERSPPRTAAFGDGTVVPWRGQALTVRLIAGAPPHVEIRDTEMLITTSRPERARAYFEAWGRYYALPILEEAVARRAEELSVAYVNVRVGDARTRWGSCSTTGRLNFSWRLAMAPPEILDYVVVHELCHVAHPNHSRAFWQAVNRGWPGYREQLRWLRTYGAGLRV